MKKIAFLRMKPFPIPNRILPEVIGRAFPEYELQIFDVMARLERAPAVFAANLLAMLAEYGPRLADGRMTRSEAFYATPYLFHWVRRQAQRWITPGEHAFSLQIQSLFDGSRPGVPHFVYTDHTHLARLEYPDFDRRSLRPERWIELERSIYRSAALNFTRSSNISRSLRDQYHIPPERVARVGVGSNLAAPGAASRAPDPSAKNILFVGIDWERKGGPDLVSAFRQVLAAHPDARLTIVGCSPSIDLPNCQVAGRVPVERMAEYYREASVFCLPTRIEPFGVVFIEALQYRLPVVATNVGAVPDLVQPGSTGCLIEPGDVDGLARALIELLDDPARRATYGENGQRLVELNYTWERVSDKMAAAIRGCLPPAA
ncbi:MAG: glycosyltransferase family 4 protein [Chloroflexota bacterium]